MPRSLLRLLAGVALAGCTAPGSPSAGPAPHEPWMREVAPFTVLDENGAPYAFPFLGGLDVPRPQLVDIDADGDLDLFVQERTDELMHFENVGTPESARFLWRTDQYQELAVGEWARFADLDGDGDVDLLAERPFSYIRYYLNQGTPAAPRFRAGADSLRDSAGAAIFADRQNIPNLGDIDCDGAEDLFIGRVEGTITRYEAAGRGPEGVARFELVSERFENIEIVGQMSGGAPSSRHGANTMFFADVDRDGDLDFFWGDFFEPGVLFIENTGSCRVPSLRTPPVQLRPAGDSLLTSGYNVPVLADIDADRDLDLFVGVLGGAFNPNRTASNNLLFYERAADGTLHFRTRRFLDGIDVGSESAVAGADLDADGRIDLLVGNKSDPATLRSGRLYWFRNTGTHARPEFRLADTLELAAAYHYAPALGDIDADGDADLLLGTWNAGVLLFRNQGTPAAPRWERDPALTLPQLRGSNATPALADIDGDGDLDLFVGEASGEINFLRNTGTRTEPRFELVSEAVAGIDVGRRSFPSFLDYDGDGDLDLVAGRETRGVAAWRNESAGGELRFTEDPDFRIPLQNLATPAWLDLDGDGRPELLSGGIAGGLQYFRRR